MGQLLLIFGTLIALNFGFGLWVSDQVGADSTEEGVVEIEQMPIEPNNPENNQAERPVVEDSAE